jgi:hypothetical protein
MDYTYEFVAVEPRKLYVQVKYAKEGYEDVIRKLGAHEFTPEALALTAEFGAYEAITIWTALDNAPKTVAVPTGPISATYSEPKAPEMVEVYNPCPDFDRFAYRAEEVMNQVSDVLLEWNWEIIPLTEEEKVEAVENEERVVRYMRQERLSATDYWMFADTPEPTQAQLDYRQALRDVPQQSGFPQNIEWPTI